mgnify:CR=1 FL=1
MYHGSLNPKWALPLQLRFPDVRSRGFSQLKICLNLNEFLCSFSHQYFLVRIKWWRPEGRQCWPYKEQANGRNRGADHYKSRVERIKPTCMRAIFPDLRYYLGLRNWTFHYSVIIFMTEVLEIFAELLVIRPIHYNLIELFLIRVESLLAVKLLFIGLRGCESQYSETHLSFWYVPF